MKVCIIAANFSCMGFSSFTSPLKLLAEVVRVGPQILLGLPQLISNVT